MKQFILSAIVAGVSVGAAVAGPGGKGPGGSPGSGPKGPSNGPHPSGNGHWGMSPGGFKGSNFKPQHTFSPKGDYHLKFGKSFSHGFCYQGKGHSHWSFSCYWPKYGCQCYWCPSTCCYYYWCEPAGCYYPVSYVGYAPPVQVQVQVTAPVTVAAPAPYIAPAVQTQTQTQTQTQVQGAGGPPAGYPGLPQ